MKDNILTHKILPLLSIFILCFFSICVTSVNAAETLSLADRFSEAIYNTLPNDGLAHFCYSSNGFFNGSEYSYISLDYSKSQVTFIFNSNNFLECSFNSYSVVYVNYWDKNFNNLGCDHFSNARIFEDVTPSNYIINTHIDGNFDIYNSNGEIVNPPTPLPEITAILVEETTKTQITEQLKTMIVGFLKYLIVLVISLIAFWKGWQFLSTQLKKA